MVCIPNWAQFCAHFLCEFIHVWTPTNCLHLCLTAFLPNITLHHTNMTHIHRMSPNCGAIAWPGSCGGWRRAWRWAPPKCACKPARRGPASPPCPTLPPLPWPAGCVPVAPPAAGLPLKDATGQRFTGHGYLRMIAGQGPTWGGELGGWQGIAHCFPA